jgi:hypothetical protein
MKFLHAFVGGSAGGHRVYVVSPINRKEQIAFQSQEHSQCNTIVYKVHSEYVISLLVLSLPLGLCTV